jgi:Na+-translocating ferredoxin:NAD+ oxidoreductase subunit B
LDWSIIWKAAIALSGLALLFGALLALASIKFHVELDPRVDEVLAVLVGTNCGACGYPGCQVAAEAVVEGKAPVDVCLAGGNDVAEAVAGIMGVDVQQREREVALVHCKGGLSESAPRAIYQGIDSCSAAAKIAGGGKACLYGCLGLGTCRDVCPVNAITIDDDHRRLVNRDRCTGCGLCVDACPRGLIEMVPRDQQVLVVCNNRDRGRKARDVCSVSCIACKKCEKVCDFEAIEVRNNLAYIDYEKCTQCGKCIEVCPTDVLVRVVPRKRRSDRAAAEQAS